MVKNNYYVIVFSFLSSVIIDFSCISIVNKMYFGSFGIVLYIEQRFHFKFVAAICIIVNIFMFIVILFLIYMKNHISY